MSTPRKEPLGDAGAWPSMTKDVNAGKRYGKRPVRRQRPKDLQHPVATIGTELRELINRQDLLLLLLSKSLNLEDILAQEEDGQSRPDDSDPDEVKENYTFAASFHSDALLDNAGWEEAFQEIVNLFLAVFKMEGSLLSYSTNFGPGNPNSYGLNFVMSEPSPREASPLGSTEKPILSIEGFGTNGREFINIQWGELPEKGSEGSVVDATKLTELLRSEWRKSGRPFISTQEYKLLNYDTKGYPVYLSVDEVYSQHLLLSSRFR